MSTIYTGKTVEEALATALEELKVSADSVEYEVVEAPTKGIFGIGAKPAKISVTKKKTDAENAADFLEGLFSILHVAATTQISLSSDEKIVIDLITSDSSAVIGYRGEILDSLQCLASAVANKTNEVYKRVVVDCEGYRDKRETTLKNLAARLAEKAKRTGRKVSLEPMNPYERRIIHSALVDVEGVKTVSDGKEPNRYISIIPDGYDPSKDDRRPRFDRGGKGGRYNDRRGGFDHGGRGGHDRRGNKGGFGGRRERTDRENEQRAPKKSGFGGGVFLGNSLKTPEEPNNEE